MNLNIIQPDFRHFAVYGHGMKAYLEMIKEVQLTGTRKENRTGVDTLSTFGHYYELWWPDNYAAVRDRMPADGALPGNRFAMPVDEQLPGTPVPLLTTKKISWKNIVVEMLWFLSGQTDISILQRHGCKFWDAWTDKDGKVPSAYGNFWRKFPVHPDPNRTKPTIEELQEILDGEGNHPDPNYNDQLAWVLGQLRTNPMSRRLAVSAWAPGNAQTSKLPPCHLLYAFNVQNVPVKFNGPNVEKADYEQRLCLHLTQRSCDLALGVPYNMASYGLLLAIMSHLTGIKPGIFAHTLLDLHIYTKNVDGDKDEFDHMPGLSEQFTRTPKKVPNVVIDPSIKELSDIEALMEPGVSTGQILERFQLVGYEPHPGIKFKVAV